MRKTIERSKHFLNRELRNFRELINFPAWYFLNIKKKSPDNHYYKKLRILNIQKNENYEFFIETGTFYGQMVNVVKKYFTQIISIEIYKPLYNANELFYRNNNKIQIIFGDSTDVLTKIMPKIIDKSILFWLDGHYSGNGTGIGDITSPIISEIKSIFDNDPKKFCIVIDDIRLFDNTDGYPFKEDIINLINSYNNIKCEFIDDRDALIIKSF